MQKSIPSTVIAFVGEPHHIETWMQVEDPSTRLVQLNWTLSRWIVLSFRNKDFPFLLANLQERRSLRKVAAIFTTNLGLNGHAFSADLFGISGSYAATDYLFAALVAPAFCGFMMVALMFNDYLSEVASNELGQISKSPYEAPELVPNLLEVAKAYQLTNKNFRKL